MKLVTSLLGISVICMGVYVLHWSSKDALRRADEEEESVLEVSHSHSFGALIVQRGGGWKGEEEGRRCGDKRCPSSAAKKRLTLYQQGLFLLAFPPFFFDYWFSLPLFLSSNHPQAASLSPCLLPHRCLYVVLFPALK